MNTQTTYISNDVQDVIDLVADQIELTEDMTLEEFIDEVNNNNMLDEEIIYYSNAIKYLSENDPSLSQAFEIADECGFELKDLSSEKLASLLATRNNNDTFNDNAETIFEAVKENSKQVA